MMILKSGDNARAKCGTVLRDCGISEAGVRVLKGVRLQFKIRAFTVVWNVVKGKVVCYNRLHLNVTLKRSYYAG